MERKSVLGKGLASLLPGAATSTQVPSAPSNATGTGPSNAATTGTGATAAGAPNVVLPEPVNSERQMGISMIATDDIKVNNYQPRRDFDTAALNELAQSIKVNGIIQPLVVRRTAEGYQLIAGERRLRASKLAGLKQVPIVIRKSTDKEALELALIENIQRQDLNCIDEALAYNQLLNEFKLTQEEVAQRVGKERATVANSLRLLRLPEQIIEDLKKGTLSLGHGKALLSVEDNSIRMEIRNQIIERGLSVRDVESLAQMMKAKVDATPEDVKAAPVVQKAEPGTAAGRFQQLSLDMTRNWNTRVEVKGTGRRGKIVFHYRTREDLDRLLEALQNQPV
ncbi:MAG: ParB/RepB/Spo0J family partition protein [Bacteriovoracia bacterium]